MSKVAFYRSGQDRNEDYALTHTYAETIAGNAPMTVNSIKQIVTEITKDESVRDIALCDRLVKACFASQDYVEGRRAFMEKRKPAFQGK